jgi:hypothetical protein
MQQQAALMQTQPTENGLQGLQDSQEPEDELALQQDDMQQQQQDDLQPYEQEGEGEAGAGLLGGRAAALAGLGSPGAQSGSGSGSDSGSEAAELERLLAQQGIKQGTGHGGQLARLLQGARPPAAAAGETPDALKVRAGSAGRHAFVFWLVEGARCCILAVLLHGDVACRLNGEGARIGHEPQFSPCCSSCPGAASEKCSKCG